MELTGFVGMRPITNMTLTKTVNNEEFLEIAGEFKTTSSRHNNDLSFNREVSTICELEGNMKQIVEMEISLPVVGVDHVTDLNRLFLTQ